MSFAVVRTRPRPAFAIRRLLMAEAPKLKIVANHELLPQIAELLREGHSVTLTVRGNSMNPLFVDRRDKVCIASCSLGRLKRGDLLLAYEASQARYVLHRLVGRAANGDFILRGDGNLQACERIAPHDVLGRVVAWERKGRPGRPDAPLWRLYAGAWMALRPVRRWLLALWRRL